MLYRTTPYRQSVHQYVGTLVTCRSLAFLDSCVSYLEVLSCCVLGSMSLGLDCYVAELGFVNFLNEMTSPLGSYSCEFNDPLTVA